GRPEPHRPLIVPYRATPTELSAPRGSSPPLEAACHPVEHELVGDEHDGDHDEGPHEHHLGGQDLPAVVHDVADAGGDAEDLGDDGDLEGEPEAALHACEKEGEGR